MTLTGVTNIKALYRYFLPLTFVKDSGRLSITNTKTENRPVVACCKTSISCLQETGCVVSVAGRRNVKGVQEKDKLKKLEKKKKKRKL